MTTTAASQCSRSSATSADEMYGWWSVLFTPFVIVFDAGDCLVLVKPVLILNFHIVDTDNYLFLFICPF